MGKNLQENITRIHQMMGIISENRISDVIKNLMDKLGLIETVKIIGLENIKKYVDDETINKQDKKDFIDIFKTYVQDYFVQEEDFFDGQPQGSEGVPLDDEDMIHLPENSDDEYDEYISHIGEDGVLVYVFHNGEYEDDYNIWWDNLPFDIYIKIFNFIIKEQS